jgi:probable addiction module antidote protein
MPKRTKSYHAWLLKRLSDPIEAERYLKVAMADAPEIFLKALRNVAEANKMAKVAEEAGVNRESLYKALSEDGNPRLSTLESVLKALGMSLTVQLKSVFPAQWKRTPAAAAAPTNDSGISGGANNYNEKPEANMAMVSMPRAYVIYAHMASNGLQQTQSAGGLD